MVLTPPNHRRTKLGPSAPAKTTAPVLRGMVRRAALFRRLDRVRRRVTWIVGPPGSGKTVLAASYLRARRVPLLWYQLEPDDADLATFFYHLRAAGQRAGPGSFGSKLPLFTRDFQPGLRSFARHFFQRLYQRLPPRFVLVFDDYHEVPEDAALHDLLGIAAAELPAHSRIFILSRTDPPAALARLRASAATQLVEWRDLRLTLSEATAIVRSRGGLRLPIRTVRELHRRTDGWVAGLVLQLEQAVRHAGSTSNAVEESREAVFDYFAGEILRTESEQAQAVIIETAFVSPISAPAATRLTGSPQAPRILERLSRRNYFTEKRPGHEPVYRYHPLFREFLLARARASLSPARLRTLQQRAAQVLAAAGRGSEAAVLLRDAEDWHELTQLIVARAPSLAAQGRTRTIEGWLGYLPSHFFASEPWLQYWRGITRLPVAPDSSRQDFERAFQLFNERRDAIGALLAWCGIVESVLYAWSDFTLLDPFIERLDTVSQQLPAAGDRAIEARVAFAALGSLLFRRPDHPDIDVWTERALSLAFQTEDISQRVAAASHVVHYRYWMGDLARAQQIIDRLNRLPALRRAAPLIRINWRWMEAVNEWHLANIEPCLRAVALALNEARTTGVHLWDCNILAQGVYATLSDGRLDDGRKYLHLMRAALDDTRTLDVSHYHYLAAWEGALRHDLVAAKQHGETAAKLAVQAGTPFPEGLARTSMAQICFELGAVEEAQGHLERAADIARRMRSSMLLFLVLLTRARLLFETQQEPEATDALRHAMALGRQQRYVNTPWWRASLMAPLCVKALEMDIEVPYVQALVRRRGLVPDTPPFELANWPWPVRIHALDGFRLERDGEAVRFKRKSQQRPLELLKALIAFGGREVPAVQVTDALWPEAEGDAAQQALTATLHRLRQLLGHEHAVTLQRRALTLDPRLCWIDVWAFEGALDQGAATARAGDAARAMPIYERAVASYHSPFLHSDGQVPWAQSTRERLRNRLLRALEALANLYEASGRAGAAITTYERAIEIEDLAEQFYQQLMRCHLRRGQRADALAVYERCRRALAVHGLTPSPDSEAIHRAILGSS